MSSNLARPERLQVLISKEEYAALEAWRFEMRMPSRSAAIRELLRRGMELPREANADAPSS